MTRKSFALAFALLVLGLPVVGRTDSAPIKSIDETAMKQTIVDIRTVGTAMYAWYKDEMAPKRSPESHKKAEDAAETKSVDISAVAAISREDLAKVLVPKYIPAIPEKDGWGTPTTSTSTPRMPTPFPPWVCVAPGATASSRATSTR